MGASLTTTGLIANVTEEQHGSLHAGRIDRLLHVERDGVLELR